MDVGSTTVKAVLVEDGRLLWRDYKRHNTKQAEMVFEFLGRMESEHGLAPQAARIFFTGSGAGFLAPLVGAKVVQEVVAVSAAVEKLHPAIRFVSEIGGEDMKTVFFTPSGDGTSKQVFMQSACSGGTGTFIEKTARKLSIETESLAKMPYDNMSLHKVSSKCGIFAEADSNTLVKSGVPVETSKGEWGLGQHELNVRYAEALDMADRHAVFKQCLKELAEAAGMSLTFMAKPYADRAGSSCHIHLSLWRDGKNAFAGRGDDFRFFLGGWIRHVPDVMVFYAPTVNSYKRYVDASWAPTRLAWSNDNRTAGFRVVGDGQSLRIECRIPGADCNPYLALAASLASGLDGLASRIEPPECFVGDVYAARILPRVPYTLAEAVALFEKSDFARRAFGAAVVEHYTHFYRTEARAFDQAVTDWERRRYFERI